MFDITHDVVNAVRTAGRARWPSNVNATRRRRDRGDQQRRGPPSSYGDVIRQRATTVAEWAERMHSAEPPTEDDVTILLDGRRLDSKESVEAWLKEVETLRVQEAASRNAAQ
jgi:hypothetical protein